MEKKTLSALETGNPRPNTHTHTAQLYPLSPATAPCTSWGLSLEERSEETGCANEVRGNYCLAQWIVITLPPSTPVTYCRANSHAKC